MVVYRIKPANLENLQIKRKAEGQAESPIQKPIYVIPGQLHYVNASLAARI